MQSQKATQLFRTLLSRQMVRKNGYHGGSESVTTYNDLPKPQGSWQTNHDALQRKYNAHLILGVGFAIGTLVFAKASGCLYLNYNEPAKPADNITYD